MLDLLSPILYFSFRFIRNADDVGDRMACGYLDTPYVYYASCTNIKNTICEKLANPVKIENTLMSEISDRKYN